MHRGKQNPPRIYLYIDVLGGGGAERVMANLANAFVSDGYDTTIITSCRVDGEYSLDEKVKRFVLEESELKQSRSYLCGHWFPYETILARNIQEWKGLL